MNSQLVNINNFIEFSTRIYSRKEVLETSSYTTVQDFFETHLSDILKGKQKELVLNTYKLKIGDRIKIHPSLWTINFCTEKSQKLGTEYEFIYIVSDIEIEYFDVNPNSESESPLLKITIILSRD
jgi:hypothetical protein